MSGSVVDSDGGAGGPAASAGAEAVAQGESPELLGRVAERLRELERAANGAVAELRREALAAGVPPPGARRPRRGEGAVLYELILTLSERADGLEREAELIAGILERARNAILHPERPRIHPSEPITGRATETRRDPSPRSGKKAVAPQRPASANAGDDRDKAQARSGQIQRPVSAGVKLLAAQMALDGDSRDEIRLRLRRDFGVTDSATAVSEVLEGEPGS